jgi:NAD(P)-dependent dehydrogenase (short-subunit alcohol dehydrogenase family)
MATEPLLNWSTSVSWTAAKEGLTRGLAVDLAPIRLNCVAPGVVHTELVEGISGGSKEKLEGILALYKSTTLTKTVGRPEDLDEAYLWLLRDTYVTGTVVHRDGGYFFA